MHKLIAVVVSADDEEEALDIARETLSSLCGDGGIYDYAHMFDDPGFGVAGPDRHGSFSPVLPVDSEGGKRIIDDAMEAAAREFRENIERVRHGLKYLTNDDILYDRDRQSDFPPLREQCSTCETTCETTLPLNGRMLKHFLREAGWATYWLYDQDGVGVTNKDVILSVPGTKWVVPADVHY